MRWVIFFGVREGKGMGMRNRSSHTASSNSNPSSSVVGNKQAARFEA